MRFGEDDVEFMPVLALTSDGVHVSFKNEMLVTHLFEGRLTESEFIAIAGEIPPLQNPPSVTHPPGRSDKLGVLIAKPDKHPTDSPYEGNPLRFSLGGGWVAAPGHPTFSVEPEMIQASSGWPEELKNKYS